MNTDLIPSLSKSLEIELPENISGEELKRQLSSHINYLIKSDFQKLVSFLYRIDVSESKLKQLLKDNADEDAASIIAELIIERQLQKIKSRQHFNTRDENIDDVEKW
ncbi:MAG: hypothetical protein EPN92_01900 [Chitinophagaceae bacterium]|nr:MAG: hypothetical protein EPN92_01900 [Chitinophagaceae bacterium]